MFSLSWPDNQPNGIWVLSVDAGRFHQEAKITVQEDPFEQPELRILPGTSFSPFDTVYSNQHSYPSGEEITFSGALYPAQSAIPLGIYKEILTSHGFRAELVAGLTARTDAGGRFRVAHRLPVSLGVGNFWAVAWQPEFDTASVDGDYPILGLAGTRDFYIRATPDSPLPEIEVSTIPAQKEVLVSAVNLGRTSTRGGSITISSPDATSLTIQDADVPILPAGWSDCNIATPHAWALTSRTPCHKALQHNTACRQTVTLSYPLAEGWYQPWSPGDRRSLTVQVQPRAGVREVRIYVRVAMLTGPSGCNMEIAPRANEADGTDQQGFPVQVVTVPVP